MAEDKRARTCISWKTVTSVDTSSTNEFSIKTNVRFDVMSASLGEAAATANAAWLVIDTADSASY
jgi:hypothetical protein